MRQVATTTVPLDSMIMSMTTLADRKKRQHYSDIAEFIHPTINTSNQQSSPSISFETNSQINDHDQ
jgi:hypothetical protein